MTEAKNGQGSAGIYINGDLIGQNRVVGENNKVSIGGKVKGSHVVIGDNKNARETDKTQLNDKGKERTLRMGLDSVSTGQINYPQLKSELAEEGIELNDGQLLAKYLIHNLDNETAKSLEEIKAPENSATLVVGYLKEELEKGSLPEDEKSLLKVLLTKK